MDKMPMYIRLPTESDIIGISEIYNIIIISDPIIQNMVSLSNPISFVKNSH